MTELAAPDAKRKAARVGALAGLMAGPVFLASVALNTWASLDYLHGLGWEFVGTEDVPWPSSLARGPHAWEQIATFVVTGLLIVVFAVSVREKLPRKRASTFAAALLGVLGAALMLAAFRVDVPMLGGGDPETWNGWAHGIGFLAIIATGVLAPPSATFRWIRRNVTIRAGSRRLRRRRRLHARPVMIVCCPSARSRSRTRRQNWRLCRDFLRERRDSNPRPPA